MNSTTAANVLVEPMTRGDIRPLFPLMRAVEPDLKLSVWLSYGRRMTLTRRGARAGIMVARRHGHSLPCGAVHYRLDRNLRYGQLLTAEHFIAIDLLYPHAVHDPDQEFLVVAGDHPIRRSAAVQTRQGSIHRRPTVDHSATTA